MQYDISNLDGFILYNKTTGEEINIDIFKHKVVSSGWEKAYTKVVAQYISCAGEQASKLLSWMILNRTGQNIITGSQSSIAEEAGVGLTLLKTVFKKLIDANLLKKKGSSIYMLSPDMIRTGHNKKGLLLLHTWDNL